MPAYKPLARETDAHVIVCRKLNGERIVLAFVSSLQDSPLPGILSMTLLVLEAIMCHFFDKSKDSSTQTYSL